MDLLYKAQTRFLFHTHIKIKISAFYSDDIFDELFAILENIDKKYNSYQAGSYFDLINKHSGIFVDVDDETIRILDKVIELSNFFDGRYDITIMPLIRLWGFYKDVQRTIPASHEIERVKPLVNYQNIEIEQNKVRIAKNQEIITASFIKAYAVDRLVEKMIQMGISDAIINAGGSTIRAITNELHPTWSVIVRNPEDNEHLFSLDISNQCYSTSSQVKTFVDINGHKYGHILNPKTGFPSEVKQVGIISDDCMIGDILSTAFFNETKDGFIKKMNLLSANYHVGGFMIDRDSEIVYTQGFLKP